MNNYQDRGLIKWMPFDALSGFGSMIYDLQQKLLRHTMPELLPEHQETLQYTLSEAISRHALVSITYYKHHKFFETIGHIVKLDPLERRIQLSTGEMIQTEVILNMVMFENTL
jgi:hypothetical protein